MKVFENGVIVDDSVYEFITDLKIWMGIDKHGYAKVVIDRKFIYVHHLVLSRKKGFEIDHINGNPLDNQRKNLRYATRSQQSVNRKRINRISGGSSKYKGVYKEIRRYKEKEYIYWTAKVKKDNKVVFKKSFKNEQEAARAYDGWAKKVHGEFAVLNFPDV
jgi:hypothetical protein